MSNIKKVEDLKQINLLILIKFLIIRFSSIGDIVLTTPVIRNLKQQVKGAEVHFLTKKQFLPVIENNPYIDKIHVLDASFSDLIHELRQEYFNYIIDLHRNLRTFRVKNKLRIIAFSFDKLNYEKWLMVNWKKNKLSNRHIVDRYMDTTKLFDVVNDQKGLDYFIAAKDEVNLDQLPENFRVGYVAFVIGAQHSTKRLPTEKIISICRKSKQAIVLLGGTTDVAVAEKIKAELSENVYNACGKYSLNQSASLVKQANVVISHDTGLMHIAAAYCKKIISIWGNTIPEFGMYPYFADESSIMIENKNLSCRPCSKIGFSQCPKKHFKCMNDLDEELIVNEIYTKMLQ